jgi:hypothetical protein
MEEHLPLQETEAEKKKRTLNRAAIIACEDNKAAILELLVTDIGLRSAEAAALTERGILTVKDLAKTPDDILEQIPYFGKKNISDMRNQLRLLGVNWWKNRAAVRLDVYNLFRKQLMDDQDSQGVIDYVGTRAIPGSPEKLAILAARAKSGLPLWHEDDRHDFDGVTDAAVSISHSIHA